VLQKLKISDVFSFLELAIFGLFPQDDYRQTLRIKRFLIAAGSYFIFCCLAWVSFALGLTHVPLKVLVLSQAGILASNIFIYVLLRTGWNKKFKDPSLTLLQITIATFWTMEVLYYAETIRSGGIFLYLVIFIFGLFKLNVRQFLFLSFCTIAGYAAVILLLYQNHPETVSLRMEILNVAVLVIVLPWFSLVGGYITNMKTKAFEALHRLQETEAKFRAIFDAASDGIVVVEIETKAFADANEKFCKMLGYAKEELLGLRIPDIHPAEKAAFVLDQCEKLVKKEIEVAKDIPVLKKDQTLFFADISASTVFLNQKEYIVGLFRDVTERKRAEELLRQSEEKYRLLVDHMKDYVWQMDMDLNITYITPSAEKVMGYTAEEFKKLSVDQFLTPESFKAVMDFYAEEMPKALADPGYVLDRTIELEYVAKDGSTIWGEASFALIRDENGKPRSILGSSRNIAERKRVEQELRASEENFHRSLDESPLGVRIATKEGETLYANQAMLDIYGYDSVEELRETPVQQRYLPESYAQWLDRREKRRRGESCPSEYEVGIIRKDGEIRYLRVFRKEILWNGRKQFQVIYNDFTDKKRMEETLRREQQRFRSLIEHSTDVIVVLNPEGAITYVNPAVERVLGYAPEERIGKKSLEVVHPEDKRFLIQSFLELTRNPEAAPFRGEVRLRHKDGHYRTVEVVGSSLLSNGAVEAVIINYRDITERKEAEEALKKSEQRYLQLSIIDDLTQLYNSRYFYEQLKKEVERSNRYEQPLTLLLMDLDRFKAFNDTYGHLEGDNVLSRLGGVIKRCLRESDSAYRYGGEEFTVLLPMTTREEGVVTAQRIQAEMSREAFYPEPGKEVYLTMSIGVAQYQFREEMRNFVNRADKLMYRAKQHGRNRIFSE